MPTELSPDSEANQLEINTNSLGAGWGVGAAGNVFFHQYFGVGLEQSTFGRNQGSRKARNADYYYWRWQTSGTYLYATPWKN